MKIVATLSLVVSVLAVLAMGCGSQEPSPATVEATVSSLAATDASVPTPTRVPPTLEPTPVPTPTPAPTAIPILPTSAEIFANLSPSIVFIETTTTTGIGLLIDGGYIVTNAHVVWPYQNARIVFPDGSEFLDVPLLNSDLMGDIAVLGPIETSTEPVILQDGEDLIIGSELILIGYPAETEEFPQPTITRGILSRFRQWDAIDMTYFQTDASIAGGQSGGVIVSEAGKVIGISGFSLSEAGFGLVASAADILPRLESLIAGEDVGELGARAVPLEGGRLEHRITLRNRWDTRVYVINESPGTPIEITVEGRNDVGVFVWDMAGNVLLNQDTGVTGVEFGTIQTTEFLPHFLFVAQTPDETSQYQIRADAPIPELFDPDDGKTANVGETISAAIGFPADIDFYPISLEEGETVEIVVDSMNIDPWVIVDFRGAAFDQIPEDDDSGGGIFGSNAKLIHTGNFFVVVGSAGDATGGYFLSLTKAAGDAVPASIAPSPEIVDGPFGTMAVFESAAQPFSIQYPADWVKNPVDPALASFGADTAQGSGLLIVEEDLMALGLDQMPLREYVDLTVAGVENLGAELTSRERFTTSQGFAAEILTFSIFGVQTGKRLIYLHKGLSDLTRHM